MLKQTLFFLFVSLTRWRKEIGTQSAELGLLTQVLESSWDVHGVEPVQRLYKLHQNVCFSSSGQCSAESQAAHSLEKGLIKDS